MGRGKSSWKESVEETLWKTVSAIYWLIISDSLSDKLAYIQGEQVLSVWTKVFGSVLVLAR
jgi:hypothetical protein